MRVALKILYILRSIYKQNRSLLFSGSIAVARSVVSLSRATVISTVRVERTIGEYVHKATQYLDEGCLDLETVDPELQPYLAAYQRFLEPTRSQLIALCVNRSGSAIDSPAFLRFDRKTDTLGNA